MPFLNPNPWPDYSNMLNAYSGQLAQNLMGYQPQQQYYGTGITVASLPAAMPEVRKALPVVSEFEWLRSRVNEILWK